MASYESVYANAKDQTTLKRLTVVLYKVAQDVLNESRDGQVDGVYVKRVQNAYRIIQQGESCVSQWALLLCSSGRLTPQTTDDDLEALVRENWDSFSGVNKVDRVDVVAQEAAVTRVT